MPKIVFVNNPAATVGGALTVLKEFINYVAKPNKDCLFYVFCTANLKEYECENIKIINNIKAKKWRDRILWDLFGLKKWSKENKIEPDIIISLQNTGVRGFANKKNVTYIHQAIPYSDVSWSILRKEERVYWFYKHIYKHLINMFIKKDTLLVVQSKWLKEKIVNSGRVKKDNVYIVRPNISKCFLEAREKNANDCVEGNNDLSIFYPANGCIYKNHRVLIEAMDEIVNNRNMKNTKIYFTLEKENNQAILNEIKNKNLEDNIVFLGNLSTEEMVNQYNKSNLMVFPSYLESYGLPLLEAATMGIPIVCADFYYSREVLEFYEGVEFINYNKSNSWVEKILDFFEKKANKRYDYTSKCIENTWEDILI